MKGLMKFGFVVLVVLFAGCAGTKEYKIAKRHLEYGEYGLALSSFKTALEKNPDFARDEGFQKSLRTAKWYRAKELFLEALSSADAGKLNESTGNLNEAIVLDPNNQQVKDALKSITEPQAERAGEAYARGVMHFDKKDWQEAKACFTQAIELKREHILARVRRFECTTKISESNVRFELAKNLISGKKLTGAMTALKESLAISPLHPEAGEVLETVEKQKAEAEELYRKAKESAAREDWNAAEKSFSAAVDIWSDYEDARKGLAEACLRQVDAYEEQNLLGHALIKCVMALEAVPDYKGLDKRARDLRDELIDSATCRVGLIVEDAGGDGRKAGKMEAAILSAQQESWPRFLKVATMAEMKISAVSPEYLIMCKVLELDAEKDKSVETKSERVKVGTKKSLNPKYMQYKKELEQLDPGCFAAFATALALQGTPEYIYEDVYETRHHVVTTYHHSASVSLMTRITEPATGTLVDSFVLSDKDAQSSDEEYGVDILSPIMKKCCDKLCRKVEFNLVEAHAGKLLEGARKSLEAGGSDEAVEACVKILLIAQERASETANQANQRIKENLGCKDFGISLTQLGLRLSIQDLEYGEDPTQTMSGKTIGRGRLGVHFQELTPELAARLGSTHTKGIVILAVEKDSAAEKAGLKQGDIIVEFNGQRVGKREEFTRKVITLEPGTMVKMAVLRDDKREDVIVKLGAWPTLTLLSFLPKDAEIKTVFEDDFTVNRGWFEHSDAEIKIEVRDGKYCISVNKGTGPIVPKIINFALENDFLIECRARLIERTGMFYGLMLGWDKQVPHNGFAFLVTDNGYVRFDKFYNEATPVIDWTAFNPAFLQKGHFNRLSVLRIGKKMRFFVNGYLVGETRYEPFFGNGFGFIVGSGEAEFDDFVVKVLRQSTTNEETWLEPLSKAEVAGVYQDTPGDLGLTVNNLTNDLARQLGFQGVTGVVVTSVRPGSIAESKGISVGTLIMEVNRKPVRNTREFNEVIEKTREKGKVLFLIKDRNYARFVVLNFSEK